MRTPTAAQLRLVSVGSIVALATALLLSSAFSRPEAPHQWSIHVSGPHYTLQELRAEAELTLRATPIDYHSKWNSADGAPWVAEPGAHRIALIYTDTRLLVLEVIDGRYASTEITVRIVGGVVGNSESSVDQMSQLETGEEYVLLLKYDQTQTREGFEGAWLPVNLGQGVFVGDGSSRYRNILGEAFAISDLR